MNFYTNKIFNFVAICLVVYSLFLSFNPKSILHSDFDKLSPRQAADILHKFDQEKNMGNVGVIQNIMFSFARSKLENKAAMLQNNQITNEINKHAENSTNITQNNPHNTKNITKTILK